MRVLLDKLDNGADCVRTYTSFEIRMRMERIGSTAILRYRLEAMDGEEECSAPCFTATRRVKDEEDLPYPSGNELSGVGFEEYETIALCFGEVTSV